MPRVGEDSLAALDVEAAGKALARSASTVREYCRAGLLPGSYKQRGREWRVPRSAIEAFHRREHEAAQAASKAITPTRLGSTDLGAWRAEIERAS